MAAPGIPLAADGRVLFTLQGNTVAAKTFPNLGSLTKNAGDLLIALVIDYGCSVSGVWSAWGAGFTEFGDFGSSGVMPMGCAYKWSDGTETGTFTVTQGGTVGGDAVTCLLSIPGAHQTTIPEAGGYANGTLANADPGSYTTSGWTGEDTLFIAVGGEGATGNTGGFGTFTAGPSGYSGFTSSGITRASTTGAAEMAVAFRQINATTENPGTFTNDTSLTRWGGFTIAVRARPANPTHPRPGPLAAVMRAATI